MIRRIALFMLGAGILAATRLIPASWGELGHEAVELMRIGGGFIAGWQCQRMAGEAWDRAAIRLRWWRTRRNGRRGYGWASIGDPRPRHPNCRCIIRGATMTDLTPEPIADAIARGDKTLHFACSNGRENGPYDLDDFAVTRHGTRRISPIGIRVDGQTIVATFADAIDPSDAWQA